MASPIEYGLIAALVAVAGIGASSALKQHKFEPVQSHYMLSASVTVDGTTYDHIEAFDLTEAKCRVEVQKRSEVQGSQPVAYTCDKEA